MADSITEDLVRHHLVEMGYDRDALPEEALNQFVNELKQMYIQGEFESSAKEFQTQKENVTTNERSQKILKSYKGNQRIGAHDDFDPTIKDFGKDYIEIKEYPENSRDFSGLSEGALGSRGSSPVYFGANSESILIVTSKACSSDKVQKM